VSEDGGESMIVRQLTRGTQVLCDPHRSTSLGSNVSIAPFLSSDPSTGGTPTSILQPRIIQLGAQIRF
jgi:hypothetical protein